MIICNYCNNTTFRKEFELDHQDIFMCEKCGLMYAKSHNEHADEYEEDYFKKRNIEGVKNKEQILNDLKKYRGRASELAEYISSKDRVSFLDIGCGIADLPAAMNEFYNWDSEGVDISEWAAKYAQTNYNINVHVGDILDLNFSKKYDVITIYHLLEHMEDPSAVLYKIYSLLESDGVLILKGPNVGSFDRKWHGLKWRGFSDVTHKYYFTEKAYKDLMVKVGFSDINVKPRIWDPISHFREAFMGDGLRADHPTSQANAITIKPGKDTVISKIYKLAYPLFMFLGFTGRDVTIIARK